MIGMWMAVTASAQTHGDRGLLDDRNYEGYARAVDGLGFAAAPGRDDVPQIGPGMIGIIATNQVEIGNLLSIHTYNVGAPHFYETYVAHDADIAEDLLTAAFSITVADQDFADNQGGVDQVLGELQADDAIDGTDDYHAGEMPVANRTIPDGNMLGYPNVASVTPASNPNLLLYCHKIVQSGTTRGWLLVERRDFGVEGVSWYTHWFYRKNFSALDTDGESLTVTPDLGANCSSIPAFVSGIKAAAPQGSPNGLDRYQVGSMEYGPLTALVP